MILRRLLLTKSKLIFIKDFLTFNKSNSESFKLSNLFQHFFFENIIYGVCEYRRSYLLQSPFSCNSLIQIIYTNISISKFFSDHFRSGIRIQKLLSQLSWLEHPFSKREVLSSTLNESKHNYCFLPSSLGLHFSPRFLVR